MKERVYHASKEELEACLNVLYRDNLRCAIILDIMKQTGLTLDATLNLASPTVTVDTGLYFFLVNKKYVRISRHLAEKIIVYRNTERDKIEKGLYFFNISPHGVAKALRIARYELGDAYERITPSSFYTYYRDNHK